MGPVQNSDTRTMQLYGALSLLLLIGLVAAAPRPDNSVESKESAESKESSENDHVTITKDFYPSSLAVYSGEHEIVDILVPLNSMNFDDDSEDDDTSDDDELIIFFVEADVDAAGGRVDKGLYMLRGGKAQKLLENGRDAAASSDDSKEVFLAASDGIYVYKYNDTAPVKYGTFGEGVISIAKENNTDAVYALTDSRHLYKVTDQGQQWTKVEEATGAKEIVLDFSNNLYFYGDDLQPYVIKDGAKKIQGLPADPKSVRLLNPPFILDDGVPFVSDNVAYILYANGTSEEGGFDFKPNARPSAYGVDAVLIQYYAYNKKIYEYNILTILLSDILEELKSYLNTNSGSIRSMASRPRTKLHPN
ncbi:unnamed protein product, partial [Iphiclides podalirius]